LAISIITAATRFGIAALLLCQSTTIVVAQSVLTEPAISVPKACTFSQPAKVIKSLKEAPEIVAEFRRLRLVVADVDESYRPFDVIDETNRDLPSRKFIRAYQFNDRTIGWYIRGGFGTSWHIFEMRYQRDRKDDPPILRATGRALSGSPCDAAQALLDGVVSSQGW
jgi:hypothetical protein